MFNISILCMQNIRLLRYALFKHKQSKVKVMSIPSFFNVSVHTKLNIIALAVCENQMTK